MFLNLYSLNTTVMSSLKRHEKHKFDGQNCVLMEKFESKIILLGDKLVSKLGLNTDFKTFSLFKLHLKVVLIPTN